MRRPSVICILYALFWVVLPISVGTGTLQATEVLLENRIAPEWQLKSLNGNSLSLREFRGRPVVLNFWATWCAPCRIESKWLTQLRTQYHANGLEVLGVSMDDPGQEAEIARFVRTFAVTYPILVDGQQIAAAYGGVPYLPQTFFIDRSGRITKQTRGVEDQGSLEANVQRVLR
jgi:peroxiredoxin